MNTSKNIAIIFFFLTFTVALTLNSWGAIINQNPWDTKIGIGWIYGGNPTIDGTTNTPDPTNALKFTHGTGCASGSGCEGVAEYAINPNQSNLYYGHWFKFDSNYDWQGTGQKITTLVNGQGSQTFIFLVDGTRKFVLLNQPGWAPSTSNLANTGYNPTPIDGQWYWVEVHVVMNTPGISDGIAHVWINGVMTHNYTNLPFIGSSQSGRQWTYLKHTPIWGSGNEGKNKSYADYFWVDLTTLSIAPIGYPGAPSPDITPPSAPTGLAVQ